jgi:hypothetical protein
MRNTCIVLGAGFSKSIANLPVTSEMFSTFKNVLKEQQLLNNSPRVSWGEEVLNFLSHLENDFLILPYQKVDKGGKILSSNYLENFEGLCSFIDLNIAFEVDALCESNGIETNLGGKSLFSRYTIPKLKEIRGYIGNYLYLALINDKAPVNLLDKFQDNLLSNCSSVINFNYDLILEKYLYKKGYWYPKDGYGFETKELPELNSVYDSVSSKIKIYKLHGSLNWKPSSIYNSSLLFKWFDDDNNYFFPNYLKKEKGNPFRYQGGFSSEGWILPSCLKQFQYSELLEVWSQAHKSLIKADEIIFIGYSLPVADSTVYSFLSSIDFSDKIIKIYDPNAEELMKNYSLALRKENIQIFPYNFENYL